jgi:putative ABC transport system permease protein
LDDLMVGTPVLDRNASGFSLGAMLLSAVGLYGVMSSAVRQQTRDIWVRVALGATARDVYRLLSEAAWLISAGAGIGLVGSALAGRYLAAELFEASPVDPVSLAVAAGSLLVIGICASMLSARRAAEIDPAISLRGE